MGFQTSIYTQPVPALAGDFADSNPRAYVNAGQGGLIAGPAGLSTGYFAWPSTGNIDPTDYAPIQVTNSFTGYGWQAGTATQVLGFVPRRQTALITTYLADNSVVIPAGFMAEVASAGSFWVKNASSGAALVGQQVYAAYSNGAAYFGSAPTAASGTSASVAAGTATAFTGTIVNNVLTLTTASANLPIGAVLSGTGVATNTQIVSLLSGTAAAAGATYLVTPGEQSVTSTTITPAWGVLTQGTMTGAVAVGQLLSGSGVAAGTYVTQNITATTWAVNNATVVSSTTITYNAGVATKWYAQSSAASGELVKISSWVLG